MRKKALFSGHGTDPDPTDSEEFARDWAKMTVMNSIPNDDPLYDKILQHITTSFLGYRSLLVKELGKSKGNQDKLESGVPHEHHAFEVEHEEGYHIEHCTCGATRQYTFGSISGPILGPWKEKTPMR